ncbi:hypothetical protein N0O92_01415 [Alkalihalobacillus sp. MEB130]|uniref:hypothetical protein n=1 Tax=Alkalihalobacillus sp. MEB130 TaxID=2976704 RepID=UPI0028DF2377|nr:hypothetical protein [Alkalihalobacillus sp. MEB130]MDT8858869.1 hypothetical protein [Alkalihalobacillus sp. MEB130]
MSDPLKRLKKGLDENVFQEHELDKAKMMRNIQHKRQKKKKTYFFHYVKPALATMLFVFVVVSAGSLLFLQEDSGERVAIEIPENFDVEQELEAIPDPLLRREIENSHELLQTFIEDYQFRRKAQSGEEWYWTGSGISFLGMTPMIENEHLDVFLTLPNHIQELIHDDPFFLLYRFNEDENFREQLLLVLEQLGELEEQDVYRLTEMEQRSIIPEYEEWRNTISIAHYSNYRKVYNELHPVGANQQKQLILDKLYLLASSFYLQTDGEARRAGSIEDFEKAKRWLDVSTYDDFQYIGYSVVRDAREKSALIEEVLRHARDEELVNLISFLNQTQERLRTVSDHHFISSQEVYMDYYQAARDLYILNEMFNGSSDIHFVQSYEPLTNEEVVERYIKEKENAR